MKWEYLVLRLDRESSYPSDMTAKLNLHGADGWELVAVLPGVAITLYFKRAKGHTE